MLKENLYLHIGTHKTGSTSIQHLLMGNSSLLNSNDYYYPMDGAYFYPPEASASILAHAALNKRPDYVGDIEIDYAKCASDIRRDINNSRCKNVILSSEHFSSAKTLEDVEKIYRLFKDLFKSITVIVYLRRQDVRLESLWAQHIKSGSITTNFEDYSRTYSGGDYFDLLKPWIKVFGKDKVVIRPFEKGQFFKGDLVQDFLEIVGCKVQLAAAKPKNDSPPIEFIEILRVFGKLSPNYLDRKNFAWIIRSLPFKIDVKKYTLFTQERRREFLENHRDSNQRVAREYLGRLDGLLFHESEISELPVYPGMSLDRFSEISQQIILLLVRINSQLTSKVRSAQQ